MIAYIEAAIGIGSIAGPFIGSIMYQIAGYKFVFFGVGTVFLIISA